MIQDKNTILARIIMGEATEEDCRFLKENCTPEEIAEILNANDLAERYKTYDRIDEEQAFQRIRSLLFKEKERKDLIRTTKYWTHYRRLLRVAAVILFIIAGAGYWWYHDYTKVTPPEIPQDVLAAIQTSRQTGKNEASVKTFAANIHSSSNNDTFSEEIIQLLLNKVDNEGSAGNEENNEALTNGDKPLELITTYHDKEFWRTLSDGTLVHINADSRIVYPEEFGRDSRDVILSGEAYFMVAKDKSRPFIVHTQQGDVKVYGTEFDINTRARDNSSKKRDCTSVVLVKGSVGVTPSEGKEYMLTPGQQIIIKDHSNSPYISKADLRPYVAWNTKKFDFEDYPLEGLMEIIYRWYHLDYVINDQSITNTLVSGSISRYDTIEPLLHAISKITGYEVQIKDNTIYINY